MPIPEAKIAALVPYDLHLSFVGIATYNIIEYAPAPTGGWALSKTIQAGAHSANPQHDAYAMTPLATGEQRLVFVSANMASATGIDPVAMRSRFTQSGTVVHSDQANDTDTGTLVSLALRAIFKAC